MSGSKRNTKRPDMNWMQIDKILWNMISVWNGSDSSKEDIIKTAMKQFGWTEKQAEKACEMHFNVYNKLKTRQNTTMNIFILDRDPITAAQLQCDKHVVKMIVESAQMLSTAHRMLDGTLIRRPSKSGKTIQQYYTFGDSWVGLYKTYYNVTPEEVKVLSKFWVI